MEHAFFGFRFPYGANFLAGICRMPLVKDVHNGHHLHGIAVAVFRVYVVLYGDKPNTKRREHIVNVLPDFDIVPAETGKVFDDDGVDYARLCVVQ